MITHNMTEICPVCEIGILTELEDSNEVQIGLYREAIPFKYSLCNTCYSEITTTEQVTLNNKFMWEFKYACQKKDLDNELTLQGDYDYDE